MGNRTPSRTDKLKGIDKGGALRPCGGLTLCPIAGHIGLKALNTGLYKASWTVWRREVAPPGSTIAAMGRGKGVPGVKKLQQVLRHSLPSRGGRGQRTKVWVTRKIAYTATCIDYGHKALGKPGAGEPS